jgi:splicing factor 3B subunit 3
MSLCLSLPSLRSIGAIEKQRFVYIMNRDSANRLTISSPLEAHKSETIIFSMCGVDVGFDNPIFALIELEYKECDEDPTGEAVNETEKKLTFYELDLGLNHVVRKWSEPISRTANLLLAVPGGDDGPSGVLICGENWVSYKNQNHPEIRTALPRRVDMPMQRGLLITSATVHKQRGLYFFMLQSELGDLYKVTLQHDENNKKMVVDVIVTVFDSIVSATSLCITKTGMMFVAAEFGNHYLLQFQKMGDDDTAIVAHSVSDDTINEELGDDSISASRVALSFQPAMKLQNLAVTDEIESLACITDMTIDDLAKEGTPQIYTLCGRGNRSTLRVLRHGISVTEMAISELPGRPNAVWTVKEEVENGNDKYIIVSFNNATLVLSIGENVEEVTDTGFLASVPTIEVVLLADNALLQVHATGIRHIRRDPHGGAEKRISEWKTPGKKQIEKASANSRQVAISLAGGEITYFEIDQAGQLVEMKTVDLGKEVSCLDIGEVPLGRARSSFLAVGDWEDRVQVLSLEPNDLLVTRSTMVVPSRPESVCLVTMDSETTIQHQDTATQHSKAATTAPSAVATTMYLNIGLVSGVLHRVAVDVTAGTLSDSRQRFLGIKPVKLFRVLVHGRRGLLALSTRAWLLYNYQGRYIQAPLSYETLEYASNFISEVCPEGIVAIAANTLRIITVDNLGAMFNQTIHPLRYTPRKLCRLPQTNYLAIIETDHNEYNELEKEELSRALNLSSTTASMSGGVVASRGDDDMELESNGTKAMNGNHEEGQVKSPEEAEDEDDDEIRIPVRSTIPPMEGHWASCLRIMDPVSGNVLELIELAENEAAFSITTCTFSHISEETFLLIGTAQNMTLHPRRLAMGRDVLDLVLCLLTD